MNAARGAAGSTAINALHQLQRPLVTGSNATPEMLTFLSATMVPEADAAVVWYGLPPLDFVDASKIRMPLLAHWATQDKAFDIGSIETTQYDAAWAQMAWERAMRLFGAHLA